MIFFFFLYMRTLGCSPTCENPFDFYFERIFHDDFFKFDFMFVYLSSIYIFNLLSVIILLYFNFVFSLI